MSAVKDTLIWIEKVIVGFNLCPFAKSPFEAGLVRISENKATDDVSRLEFFVDEVALLELNLATDIATSVLVYTNSESDFEAFNDFSGLCDDYLKEAKLDHDFQTVVFHPGFFFQGDEKNDRGNLVGKSPYPIIHILRNSSLNESSNSYPDVDLIPIRNLKRIKDLSPQKFNEISDYTKPS